MPDDVATRLLDRFEEVGLVDDDAFARSWVASRQPGKGLARRALAQELRRKGIDDEVAREALDEIDPADEEAAARALVRKKLRSLARVDDTIATRAWSACSPARATRRGSLSRWCARSSRRTSPGVRHDGRVSKDKSKRSPKSVEQFPFRLPAGPVDLASIETDAAPGFDGGKKKGKAALFALGDELSDLQERLFAEGRAGSTRRLLLVLQGMDTSGKGGVLRHTVGLVDPQGVRITSFKAPTEEELRHDFLWRIRRALPEAGLRRGLRPLALRGRADRPGARARVRRRRSSDATPRSTTSSGELVESGTVLVKCMLHISPDDAEGAAAGPARRPEQALEVQPRRRRRAAAVAGLPARPTRSPWSGPTPSTRPGS